jgi:hypothetical protein
MNDRAQIIVTLTIVAIIITVITFLFPAVGAFGGYAGITYHGFPIGWMGETRGIGSIVGAYSSLQQLNYLAGFIIDVLFWFCVAFIFFILTLSQRKPTGRLKR